MNAIFYAVGSVSGVLTLVAFALACITVVKLGRDRANARILHGTDDSRKAEVVDALRDRLRLDTAKLTRLQTFELARLELDRQVRNERRRFALSFAALVVAAAMTAISVMIARGPVDLTFRASTNDGAIVYSERRAIVRVQLPSGDREGQFAKDGIAVIKGVPREYLESSRPVIADIYFYKQKSPGALTRLTTDIINIEMVHAPEGTPEGFQSKRMANLMLLKLLAPYRAIAASTKLAYGETTLPQYCAPEFRKAALAARLDEPVAKLRIDADKAFDVLSEFAPLYRPEASLTLGHTIEKAAKDFKESVSTFSMADPLALDPNIRRALNVLSQSNFVEIASSGWKVAFKGGRLHEGFLDDLCHAAQSAADANVLNPFSVFYRM